MTVRLEEQISRYAAAIDDMAPDLEALFPHDLAAEIDGEDSVVEITVPLRAERPRSRIPGWVAGVAAAAAVLILALPLWLSLFMEDDEVATTAPPKSVTTAPDIGIPGLVRNPENGHFYQAVVNETDSISWDAARERASAMTLQGVPGHLATITSEEEGLFIKDNFADVLDAGPFIGGFQPLGSSEPDGGWRWVTGEPFDYTSWGQVEPNNDGGDEACIQVFDGSPPIWNDFPCRAGSGAVFLVEYDVAGG